jgi:uncharacterized tellurite resistance protein B-like protein
VTVAEVATTSTEHLTSQLSEAQRSAILKLLLKIADVGHVISPIEQNITWVVLLETENFIQVLSPCQLQHSVHNQMIGRIVSTAMKTL